MNDRLTQCHIIAEALDEIAAIERDYGDAGLQRRYHDRAAEIRRNAKEAARREAPAWSPQRVLSDSEIDGLRRQADAPRLSAADEAMLFKGVEEALTGPTPPADDVIFLDGHRYVHQPVAPSPTAPDDLVGRLRAFPSTVPSVHEAADTIEAQRAVTEAAEKRAEAAAAEVAKLRTALCRVAGELGVILMLPSGGVGSNPEAIVNRVRMADKIVSEALAGSAQ